MLSPRDNDPPIDLQEHWSFVLPVLLFPNSVLALINGKHNEPLFTWLEGAHRDDSLIPHWLDVSTILYSLVPTSQPRFGDHKRNNHARLKIFKNLEILKMLMSIPEISYRWSDFDLKCSCEECNNLLRSMYMIIKAAWDTPRYADPLWWRDTTRIEVQRREQVFGLQSAGQSKRAKIQRWTLEETTWSRRRKEMEERLDKMMERTLNLRTAIMQTPPAKQHLATPSSFACSFYLP